MEIYPGGEDRQSHHHHWRVLSSLRALRCLQFNLCYFKPPVKLNMTIFPDGIPEIYTSPWAIYLPGGGRDLGE
jgi:hypothetical protein